MHTTRKQFLRNIGLLLSGTALLRQNIFATNTVNQKTATCDLATLFSDYNLTNDSPPFGGHLGIPDLDVSYMKPGLDPVLLDVEYCDDIGVCDENADVCNTEEKIDCKNISHALKYDVYFPDPNYHDYGNCPLPALIYVHGGGYSDCSKRDSNERICQEFAKRGFVTYNCEYRRGRVKDPTNGGIYTSASQELAGYRAYQDIRGAIRTIISRASDNDYKIDPSYIFLAGESAGSIAVLNAAYYPTNSTLVDGLNSQIFPHSGTYTIDQVLGHLDVDYYDSDNYQSDYIGNIRGVLNQWGGVFLPPAVVANNAEPDFFAGNSNLPPVISFCGALDPLIDYESQPINYSPNGDDFNSDSNCLLESSFVCEDDVNTTDLIIYGSKYFFEKVLMKLPDPDDHMFCELYVDSQMLHGLNAAPGGLADFGTGFTDVEDVEDYIVKRASTFFQAIITGHADTIRMTLHNSFTDCCNVRKKQQTSNHDCTTSDCP